MLSLMTCKTSRSRRNPKLGHHLALQLHKHLPVQPTVHLHHSLAIRSVFIRHTRNPVSFRSPPPTQLSSLFSTWTKRRKSKHRKSTRPHRLAGLCSVSLSWEYLLRRYWIRYRSLRKPILVRRVCSRHSTLPQICPNLWSRRRKRRNEQHHGSILLDRLVDHQFQGNRVHLHCACRMTSQGRAVCGERGSQRIPYGTVWLKQMALGWHLDHLERMQLGRQGVVDPSCPPRLFLKPMVRILVGTPNGWPCGKSMALSRTSGRAASTNRGTFRDTTSTTIDRQMASVVCGLYRT